MNLILAKLPSAKYDDQFLECDLGLKEEEILVASTYVARWPREVVVHPFE